VIALLVNPDNEMAEQHIRTTQEGARAKGIKLAVLKARTEAAIDAAFEQLQARALLVSADAFFNRCRAQLVALSARYAIPAMYYSPRWVSAGGLISYGTDTDALFRLAGNYAGRILKGANPADLPVPQPTTFQLVVNLKTAKALGLTIPPSILARADDVIE
jgi:putative ABC transport system substrate-binding protein